MVDHRNYPVDGNGDCKINALCKSKLMMEAGFPRQALLKAIVRDLHGEGMPSLP
jgi:predicted transglutaminase-like cysteine proteinase